jgi:predicted metal-binding membrane protein
MIGRDRNPASARSCLFFLSAAAWILLFADPRAFEHCPAAASGTSSWLESLRMLLDMHSLAAFTTDWALMLVAMMSPALIPPFRHIWLQSFRHRRARSTVLFVGGYGATWMVAGMVLIALALGLHSVFQKSPPLLAWVVFGALVWQFSPVKQVSLNRGHAHPPLRAVGGAADRDALLFGVAHGIWCVGSCWPFMLLTLVVPNSHVAVMAALTLLVFAERLERPVAPRWTLRAPGRAVRLAIAQARLQLERS